MDTNDYGPAPYVVNIEELTLSNDLFRVTKWTGSKLQMTLMAIPVGGEIGLEKHDDVEQFLRIESGKATVFMGENENQLDKTWEATDKFAIFVPKGTWHNIVNSGDTPLKIYSIYSPPNHAHGTIHETYEDAERSEQDE